MTGTYSIETPSATWIGRNRLALEHASEHIETKTPLAWVIGVGSPQVEPIELSDVFEHRRLSRGKIIAFDNDLKKIENGRRITHLDFNERNWWVSRNFFNEELRKNSPVKPIKHGVVIKVKIPEKLLSKIEWFHLDPAKSDSKKGLLEGTPSLRPDFISCFNLIYHYNASPKAQQRILRVFSKALKPGGVLVTDAEQSSVRNMAENAGLNLIASGECSDSTRLKRPYFIFKKVKK